MLKPWVPRATKDLRVDLDVVEETAIAMAQATIESTAKMVGLSRSGLASEMGRPRSFITRIMGGNHNITVRTLARALGACGFQLKFERMPLGWVWTNLEDQGPQANGHDVNDSYGLAA